MASGKVVLSVCNVTKVIRKEAIIKNISLNINRAEIVGFVGRNGAGKTTTLKTILGLLPFEQGTIQICGYNIRSEYDKAMLCVGGFVDTPSFYKHMTALQNLSLYIGMYPNVDKDRIKKVLAIVGLDKENKKVGAFSCGMNQRLGIARAILHEPRILILDEPTNGLDPNGIMDMRSYLFNYAKQKNGAVLISSHNLLEIKKIIDKVIWIDNGCIVGISDVDEESDIEMDFFKYTNGLGGTTPWY